MTISKEITRLEHSAVKLTLRVAQDEVCSQYDKILVDYSKSLQIPGFRKGKAPKAVLERKFGDSLKKEVLNRLLEETVSEAFKGEDFPKEVRPLPYSSPEIQEEPVLDLGTDLVFSLVYDAFPEVTMGQWQGLEVEVPDVVAADEDINRELEVIRERNAMVFDKDDAAPAAQNDVVTVDYCELTSEGAVQAGTEREDFVFTLGSGHNLFKFDDAILGMKKGESKDIEKTYPEDFEDKDLAGKTKRIRVSLKALKEKKLPDLDDDLAQDVDEKYHTLEDLKNNIRDRLTKEIADRLQDLKINGLLEKIMETTPVDIPESMIRFQIEARWRDVARRANMPVEDMMNMMQNSQGDLAALTQSWRPDAVRSLHSRIIVETLIRELHFEASAEEVQQQLETLARNSGAPLEEIKAYYEKEGMQEYLEEGVKEKKLFERLLAENSAKLGEKKGYLEFTVPKPQL